MNQKKFLAEYKKLNPQQKKAVDEIEGPVMVIAGPGTGKTQIIALRIANILRRTQINPSGILCLTFTNSGVFAMKERLLEIIGPASYQIQVHTFHAFCNEVINTFPEKFLRAKKINQLDELEQIFLLQDILKSHHFKHLKPLKSPFFYQKAILENISKLKQESITPKVFASLLKNEEESFMVQKKDMTAAKIQECQSQMNKNNELKKIYELYQKKLISAGQYDYNDMILFVLQAFKEDEELLSFYQEKFQYLLVDEYQDTNTAQNEITKLLASFYELPNIFVVGDDEQAIFRFQGASMENILAFRQEYPATKIIILETNYRSGQNILDASRAVIQKNKEQIYNRLKISKRLKSRTNVVSDFKIAQFSNGSIENFFISKEILELINVKKIPPSEIAVFYKEHRDAEELIDFLSKLNVPYKIKVGENIFDDPEINKLITFFKVLQAEGKKEDNQFLLEIMHYPFFKLSPLDIYKIVSKASYEKKNIFTVLSSDLNLLDLENPKQIVNFLKIILECRQIIHNNTLTQSFELIINKTGYLDYLLSLQNDIRHLNRLQTLFKHIQQLNLKQKNLTLLEFLEHLELLTENRITIKEEEISADFAGVNLMTAHQSKGLEFDVVFLIRLVDKHWGNKQARHLIKLPPNLLRVQKSIQENDEEERRLFYVSVTRARKRVYLVNSQSYGEKDAETFHIPSKFISEIPKKYLKAIKTKPYEQQFDQKLKLKFQTVKWHESKKMTDFLKAILVDFQLNPTALNTFLECPQRFFYDNILRVPKAKTFSQSYGTAIHSALEMFFKKYQRDLILPGKPQLVEWFKESLGEEILSKDDFERALKIGPEVLKKYYEDRASTWRKRGVPISCEFSFSSHNVYFKNIPITGRIDKIELMDSISGKVRIIDYKTSPPKSQNYILGLTKQKDLSLLYQGFFYRLLSESDPLFSWSIGEIVFDYVSEHSSKEVPLPIENAEYQKFKELIQNVYQKIVNLDFPREEKSCRRYGTNCEYWQICQTADH